MTPEQMWVWLDKYINMTDIQVVKEVTESYEWKSLSTDEKLTMVLLILGRIRR